jgi:hypothetical protein
MSSKRAAERRTGLAEPHVVEQEARIQRQVCVIAELERHVRDDTRGDDRESIRTGVIVPNPDLLARGDPHKYHRRPTLGCGDYFGIFKILPRSAVSHRAAEK